MVIIRERREPLVEMARFKGFGITIEVRSDDHGKFGNKESPAHAHILDNSGKEVAQVVLTLNAPEKPSEIIWHRTPHPPKGLDAKIIKLVKAPNKAAQKIGAKETIWESVLRVWTYFHEP